MRAWASRGIPEPYPRRPSPTKDTRVCVGLTEFRWTTDPGIDDARDDGGGGRARETRGAWCARGVESCGVVRRRVRDGDARGATRDDDDDDGDARDDRRSRDDARGVVVVVERVVEGEDHGGADGVRQG